MHFHHVLVALVASLDLVYGDDGMNSFIFDENRTRRCVTSVAFTPAVEDYQTRWATQYTSCTTTSTCTVIRTSTPAEVITTVTSTATSTVTDPTATSTATESFTSTETQTATTTETETTTSTEVTTTTSTSTQAAAESFRPIQQSWPGSTYDGSGGGSPIDSNAASSKRSTVSRIKRQPDPKPRMSRHRYPQGVFCTETRGKCRKEVVTVTSTTTLAALTSTVSTTVTSTTTTTPLASTTVSTTATVETTTTETATTTETETTTSTVADVTTVYAACATNNFVTNGPDGQEVDNPSLTGYFFQAANAYECCVASITQGDYQSDKNAQVWQYRAFYQDCLSYTNEMNCPNPPAQQLVYHRPADDVKCVIGNGYCGQVTGYIDT